MIEFLFVCTAAISTGFPTKWACSRFEVPQPCVVSEQRVRVVPERAAPAEGVTVVVLCARNDAVIGGMSNDTWKPRKIEGR